MLLQVGTLCCAVPSKSCVALVVARGPTRCSCRTHGFQVSHFTVAFLASGGAVCLARVRVSTRSNETESAAGVAPSSANRVASVEDISSVSETDLPECLSTNGEFKSGEHRLWMSLLPLLVSFVVGFDVISNVQIRCYDVPLW